MGNDTSLPADNPFPVKENLTEQNIKQKESIKTLGGKIKDEKIRKTENRKIARISGLWTGKIYKYENLGVKKSKQSIVASILSQRVF